MLCVCMAQLAEEDWESWRVMKENRDIGVIMSDNYERLEKNLHLLGVTSLEDELQDQVGLCIQDFRKAGINIWMITGDKLETAENIGFSCSLFNFKTHLFRIDEVIEGYIK